MIAALLPVALPLAQVKQNEVLNLEGWTVRVERSILDSRPKTWGLAKKQLQSMLIQVDRKVPEGPLAKLKTVPIWIHLNVAANPGAAYHPSADWLREHGYDPAMAKGIELGTWRTW